MSAFSNINSLPPVYSSVMEGEVGVLNIEEGNGSPIESNVPAQVQEVPSSWFTPLKIYVICHLACVALECGALAMFYEKKIAAQEDIDNLGDRLIVGGMMGLICSHVGIAFWKAMTRIIHHGET